MTYRPPGATTRVEAERVLVIAPHYDDEVLGCGGLVAQLTAAGAAVDVVWLSDGAATAGDDEEPGSHARLRRREAEAAADELGLGRRTHLDLPDGELAQRLDEIAGALGEALAASRPELLLVPSPLEVTTDHGAAFAALHRLLAPLRPPAAGEDAALTALARDLVVLAYEVNHPQYPDLLVDITAERDRLAAAMACHASQQERHDYLAAALGLARYRTLSLPPEVEAAEGYRRLGLVDFTTRSPAQLIRHLGGVPAIHEVREGPSISVVVRTRDRPELLAAALASLAEGSYRRLEVVLVNDGGAPPEVAADFPLPVVRVELEENRGRAAAAQVGVERAGGAYVAFLDDDDLAAPEHLATLASLVATEGVRVAYTDAAVGVYELDGSAGWRCVERRLPYSRDFDPELLLLDNYIPFNTLLIERSLFAEAGPFDPAFAFFEDWELLIRLAERVVFHHLPRVTCEYRQFRGAGHHVLGNAPRRRGDFLEVKARVIAKHAARLTPELAVRAVDTLRRELVELGEEEAAARRTASEHRDAARRAERRRAAAEERYHRAHGETRSLAGEVERLERALAKTGDEVDKLHREMARLYDEEQRLSKDLARQTRQIGRTYAEIERLEGMRRQMEETRAWRFHQWWQRRLGR